MRRVLHSQTEDMVGKGGAIGPKGRAGQDSDQNRNVRRAWPKPAPKHVRRRAAKEAAEPETNRIYGLGTFGPASEVRRIDPADYRPEK